MKLLITGFEPFSGDKINPSKLVAKELPKRDRSVHILPVSYKKAREELLKIIEIEKPDYIISLGLNAKAKEIKVEKAAYNLMKASKPDEDGVLKTGEKIVSEGQDKILTKVDIKSIVSRCQEIGIPIEESSDPGRFVCNDVYYTSLSSKVKGALFIHLPKISCLSLEKMVQAVEISIETISK